MKDNQIANILAAGIKIPPCPKVLTDLQQVLNDPDSGNQVLVRLIGRDIKLTSAVFQMANSASMSPGRKKIVALDQAVALLGRQAVSNIVRAAALRLSLDGPDPRLERFWERSMNIAMLCGIIAGAAPNSRAIAPDEAFTAGLFHDCGVAVLMQYFPTYCHAFASRKKPMPEVVSEDDIFKISHCLVGEMIAREWNLPDVVSETIRSHHEPLTLAANAGAAATAILLLATHIANIKAQVEDAEWDFQRPVVLDHLGLDEGALESFEGQVWASFEVLH